MSNLNHYRHRKVGKKFFVSTDHGSWLLLEECEFRRLQKEQPEGAFAQELEEKGMILTDKSKAQIKKEYLERYSYLYQGTSLHIVVVTLRCNQKCLYCHASSRGEKEKQFDMTEETAMKTLDFIFKSPSKHLTIEFQGGEPLLNFDIVKKIAAKAREMDRYRSKDLRLSLVTNLTLMTEDILKDCLKHDISICTSIDGPKELHDKNRPCIASSYDLASSWLGRISKEYTKHKVLHKPNAIITVSKASLGFPEEIVDTYLSLGLEGIHLRYLNNLGYAAFNKESIDYSAEEFIEFWKKAMDYIIRKNSEGKFIRERGSMIILKKLFEKTDPNYLEMRSPCGAVMGQMAYNHDGRIFSCDEGRMLEGGIFEIGGVDDGYSNVATSENSAAIISASLNEGTICEFCAYKPFCGICPVCNYAEQGTLVGVIPQTKYCKVFMAQFDYIIDRFHDDPAAKKVFERWLEFY